MAEQETVFITGGAGFLGSRIVTRLLSEGYKVVVLKRDSSNLDRLSNVVDNKNLSFFNYKDGLRKYFEKNKIDFIIHAATCYGRAKDSFVDVAFTNLVLPLELTELALQHSVKAFINADTFFNIKIGLGPKEKSYVTTKKLFLDIASEAVKNSHLKFVNMRIEQMYGPGDGNEKFVISILNNLLHNKLSLDLTKGEQKRDFVYVDDAAVAFVKAVQKYNVLRNYEEFGVGCGKYITIKKAVSIMKKIAKSRTSLNWGVLPYRKNEIMASKAAVKNNKKIDWKPKISFEDGVNFTIKSLQS